MGRTSSLAIILFLLPGAASAFVAGGCGVTPAVTVVRVADDERVPAVAGDAVKVRRGGLEGYSGLRGGFFVVRSQEDWHNAWANSPDAGPEPRMPATLNTARSMLLIGVSERKGVAELRIEKVMETGDRVHVWVREVIAGEGCASNREQAPLDAVTAPRIDKPVQFYVRDEPTETCGKGPGVTVKCRVNEAPAWSANVAANTGDVVDCEATADLRGKYAVIDTALSVAALPPGSAAKLAFTKGTARGTFKVDVFGEYKLRGEATDESNRKGSELATIEVMPPKSRDVVVQLVWTNFDASDDPSTFPRVLLRAWDSPKGPPCSGPVPVSSLCEVKIIGANTQMTLKTADKKIALDVRYADERVAKGPAVCLQTFFGGAKTGEVCDHDHRSPDDAWKAGSVDTTTGHLLDANGAVIGVPDAGAAAPPAPARAPEAISDAGTTASSADASTPGDAGTPGTANDAGGGGVKKKPSR